MFHVVSIFKGCKQDGIKCLHVEILIEFLGQMLWGARQGLDQFAYYTTKCTESEGLESDFIVEYIFRHQNWQWYEQSHQIVRKFHINGLSRVHFFGNETGGDYFGVHEAAEVEGCLLGFIFIVKIIVFNCNR